jgi:hypothetical protein
MKEIPTQTDKTTNNHNTNIFKKGTDQDQGGDRYHLAPCASTIQNPKASDFLCSALNLATWGVRVSEDLEGRKEK